MNRVNFIALGVVAVVAFVASSLWYSPLLFGRQFVELSGVAGSPQPNAVKALCELLRTFVLAYVIARLIVRLNVTEWRAALGVGLWLWVGFPVVLLTGSMLWQNVPWQLAAIHSGDSFFSRRTGSALLQVQFRCATLEGKWRFAAVDSNCKCSSGKALECRVFGYTFGYRRQFAPFQQTTLNYRWEWV
jgi:hypothetical protein